MAVFLQIVEVTVTAICVQTLVVDAHREPDSIAIATRVRSFSLMAKTCTRQCQHTMKMLSTEVCLS